mmetsp:Transcript_11450/g.10112  ORF Transcript_11450/g.10112 Transcript_11450/m.10112 type:complete len:115 (+) Transcript_11450:762-1106(+)
MNTTFTMIIDCSSEVIDSYKADYYLDTIWRLIKDHYPLKLVNIHLANVQLETTHMISKLSDRVVYHDEFYKASLLEYFHQDRLHSDFGGNASEEYDLTKLKTTNDLSEFITSYV